MEYIGWYPGQMLHEKTGWYPGQYLVVNPAQQSLKGFERWIVAHKEILALTASLGTLGIAYLAYRRR